MKALFDEPSLHAHRVDAVKGKVLVSHGVVGLTPAMRPAIDFDRELRFGHIEVNDGVREDHLAPHLDAELPFPQCLPKDAL